MSVTTAYDGYARLTAYTRTGTAALAMQYNGLDQRVQLTIGTVAHRFVQDGAGRTPEEYGANGTAPTNEFAKANFHPLTTIAVEQ